MSTSVPPRLVFMGSKASGLAIAELLCTDEMLSKPLALLCADDRADPRSCLREFEALGVRAGVPVLCIRTADELLAAILPLAPATVIVHGWYRIIPVERLPRLRFYGFHYSPLPAYRGNAPLVWQIMRGEQRIGVSFFRYARGIDDGDIVCQRSFELGGDDSIADALERAETIALGMIRETVAGLLDDRISLQPQPAEGVSWCGLRVPDDGRIDWGLSAREVHDFVRAQTRPYPGAFTTLGGRRLRIWRTRVDGRTFYGVPGAVGAVEGDEVVVTCGSGSAIRILACALDGEADAPPSSVLSSLRLRLGRETV
jgi:methionyl-tRNA formyltransferase